MPLKILNGQSHTHCIDISVISSHVTMKILYLFYPFYLFYLLGPPFHCDEEDVNRHFSKYIKICSRISSLFQAVSELYSAPLVGDSFCFVIIETSC